MDKQGTPRKMKEAIELAICTMPAGQGMEVGIEHFRWAMRDFLAQKFQIAIMSTEIESERDAIMELWNRIISE